ncbi:hypothetical protein ACH5RR_026010 [Cinchona calisaya]|uniref:Uncharacterized protein n=1 Tax=Cinchona calisaya TaxID=153742 RepID=A0ABD2Z2F7_9GENT
MAYNHYYYGLMTPPVVQHQANQANANSEVLNLNMQDALLAQQSVIMSVMNNIAKALENLEKPSSVNAMSSSPNQPNMVCDFCGGGHANGQCEMPYGSNEKLNYVSNQSSFPRNPSGAYGKTYSLSWRNHPNFSWRNTNNQSNPPYQPNPPPQNVQRTQALSSLPRPYQPQHQRNFQPNSYQSFPNLSFQNQQPRPHFQYENSSQPMYHDQYAQRENVGKDGWKKEAEYLRRELERKNEEHMRDYENLKASMRNLEIQLGQLARLNNERPLEMPPSDTIPNPKEQYKAITLRSGKELEDNC